MGCVRDLKNLALNQFFSLRPYFDLNAQGFTANILSTVHPLLVAVKAQRWWHTYFVSLKHRDLDTSCIVMNVRFLREDNHISCRFDNSSDVNTHLGWVTHVKWGQWVLFCHKRIASSLDSRLYVLRSDIVPPRKECTWFNLISCPLFQGKVTPFWRFPRWNHTHTRQGGLSVIPRTCYSEVNCKPE